MNEASHIKRVSYLILLPFLLIGIIAGTVWFGFGRGLQAAIEYWLDE